MDLRSPGHRLVPAVAIRRAAVCGSEVLAADGDLWRGGQRAAHWRRQLLPVLVRGVDEDLEHVHA